MTVVFPDDHSLSGQGCCPKPLSLGKTIKAPNVLSALYDSQFSGILIYLILVLYIASCTFSVLNQLF